MSEQERERQFFRYWLWAVALLHFVCLLLMHRAPEPQAAVTATTNYACNSCAAQTPRA